MASLILVISVRSLECNTSNNDDDAADLMMMVVFAPSLLQQSNVFVVPGNAQKHVHTRRIACGDDGSGETKRYKYIREFI